jgi:hypothetical protein
MVVVVYGVGVPYPYFYTWHEIRASLISIPGSLAIPLVLEFCLALAFLLSFFSLDFARTCTYTVREEVNETNKIELQSAAFFSFLITATS